MEGTGPEHTGRFAQEAQEAQYIYRYRYVYTSIYIRILCILRTKREYSEAIGYKPDPICLRCSHRAGGPFKRMVSITAVVSL